MNAEGFGWHLAEVPFAETHASATRQAIQRPTRQTFLHAEAARLARSTGWTGLVTCLCLFSRKTRKLERRARQGGRIAPEDPILCDPALHGKGFYSQSDFLRFLQTAKAHGWADLEVEGTIPEGLNGTLYHVGPGRFYRGSTVYKHFLDGDGFLNAFRFQSGTVQYKGDFVRTPEYQCEEAADAVLYRGAFGTAKPGGVPANIFDLRSKNLANTNVMSWGGKLLALYEAAHPSKVDATTLAYLGDEDFQGLLSPGVAASSGFPLLDGFLGLGGDAFTAHPKIDPKQRRLVGFSWSSKSGGIEIQVHEWDEEFRLVTEPGSCSTFLEKCDSSPHDFGLTEKSCVFLENRFRLGDLPGYLLGVKGPAESLVSEPALPQRIHILSRSGNCEAVVIDGSCGVFDVHIAHCHDGPPAGWSEVPSNQIVTVYTSSWDEFPEGNLFGEWTSGEQMWPFELPAKVPPADMNKTPRTRLVRHVIDAASQKVLDRSLVAGSQDLCMEHPTINPSFAGSPKCRYIYMIIGNDSGLSSPPCGWAKVDLLAGESQRWFAGSRAFADEPHFVPRAPQNSEDDGYLLAMLFDAARGQSCVCVLDAAKIDEGPIGRAWLPHSLPHSLHGCWVP